MRFHSFFSDTQISIRLWNFSKSLWYLGYLGFSSKNFSIEFLWRKLSFLEFLLLATFLLNKKVTCFSLCTLFSKVRSLDCFLKVDVQTLVKFEQE